MAQALIGIKAGYTDNYMNTDLSGRNYTQIMDRRGYGLGINCKVCISPNIAVQAELELMQKNYSYKRTDKFKGIYQDYNNAYLQIPLMAQIKFFEGPRISVALNGGLFGAYWIYAKTVGVIPNVFDTKNQIGKEWGNVQEFFLTKYDEEYQFDGSRDNRFEYGVKTGLFLQYDLDRKFVFFVEYSYYHSFSDIQKKYMLNQTTKMNQTFLMAVGLFYRFNIRKYVNHE